MEREIKVRRKKNKIQTKILPIKKVKYWDAVDHFSKLSLKRKIADEKELAKIVFKRKKGIPRDYVMKGGRKKYDIMGIDTPLNIRKIEKLPEDLRIKRSTVIFKGQKIDGFSYDSNRLFHTTSINSFYNIMKEGKLKPKGHLKRLCFTVDKNYKVLWGNIKIELNKKNVSDKVKPITYFKREVYDNFLEKHRSKDPDAKIPWVDKRLIESYGKYEREWDSKKPVNMEKKNIKQIIFIKDDYKGKNMKKDIKKTKKLAKKIGVRFKVSKTGRIND